MISSLIQVDWSRKIADSFIFRKSSAMFQFGSDELGFLELSQMAYVGIGVVITIFGKVSGCILSNADNPLEYSPQQ